MMFIKLIFSALALFVISTVNAGPAYLVCVFECELACTGINVIPVALPIYLACAAACPAACLVTCFHETTSLKAVRHANNSTTKIPISEVVAGDLVETYNDATNKVELTAVLSNKFIQGPSSFITFRSEDGHTLTVTDTHVMKVIRNDLSIALSASKIKIGDHLVDSMSLPHAVASIDYFSEMGKYDLITASGTVLANDLQVSTICAEAVDDGEAMWNSTMKAWRAMHHSLH